MLPTKKNAYKVSVGGLYFCEVLYYVMCYSYKWKMRSMSFHFSSEVASAFAF